MIRLLEFQNNSYFSITEIDDGDTHPAYAILSHTWSINSKEELSYEDVLRNEGADKPGYKKIQFCLKQANKDGLRYCWVDTCCIDKRNNTELSTAINSMFRWYQNATRCYVYLSDVESFRPIQPVLETAFKNSRWFKRGWTLQELLAPASVEFFSSDGVRLGDKQTLAQIISESTGIPRLALLGAELSEFSVEERKSWAKIRETKLPEDGAYCLFGIFDVSTFLNYGEGRDKAFRRLDEEIRKEQARLNNHMLDELLLAKRHKLKIDDALSAERMEEIINCLRFDQIETRRLMIKSAHTKTCEWLLKSSQYLEWQDDQKRHSHHGFLWIKGKPGSGKSTTMKYALESARKQMKDAILISFFFNARGFYLEKSVIGTYRTLLVQLLENLSNPKPVFEILGPKLAVINSNFEWGAELLKQLITRAIEELGASFVVCFIDALDEGIEDEIRDMISFLEGLCEQAMLTSAKFQVCLASRHYPHITLRNGLQLILEGEEGHRQDINKYLQTELKIGYSEEAERIRAELSTKASGVFIWVALVVGLLNKEYDKGRIHQLRQTLAKIPNDVHNLFRDILSRDLDQKDELGQCLQWILFSRQPLNPRQLTSAIIPRINGGPKLNFDDDTAERFVVDVSKGLAETTRSKERTVQFIHESVEDFLLKEDGFAKIWPEFAENLEAKCHEQLKRTCISHFNINLEIPTSQPDSLFTARSDPQALEFLKDGFPFVKYAVENVLYHANRAATGGISQCTILKIFETGSHWVELVIAFERIEYKTYTLQVKGIDGNQTLGAELALYIASRQGHEEIVKLLIDNGADVNHQTLDANSALYVASLQGYKAIAGILISSGANVNFKDVMGNTILIMACKRGHKEIADLLIAGGADINAKNNIGDAALAIACYGGQKEIFNLLIARGADINTKDNKGHTLLIKACKEGHKEFVVLLLASGADVNHQAAGAKTALYIASLYGHREIVQTLIASGANIDHETSSGETALYIANLYKHRAIVDILIASGADANRQTSSEETALYVATFRGRPFQSWTATFSRGADQV